MEFSWVVTTKTEDKTSDTQGLHDGLDKAFLADELGINPFFMEHHFGHNSGPWASGPFQWGAYLVPQIKNTVVGFGVICAPYHHPVEMAENMNLLDQLSQGRVVFGVGSGYAAAEGIGFGLKFDDQMSNMAGEAIDILEQLWAKEDDGTTLHFETKYYRGDVLSRIVPAPYGKFRPTVISTASGAGKLQRAAERGWPIFAGMYGARLFLVEQLREYRQALLAADHDEATIHDCMRWTTGHKTICVADTDEEAYRAVVAANESAFGSIDRQAALRARAEVIGGTTKSTGGFFVAAAKMTPAQRLVGSSIWGTPDTVAAEIQKLADLGIGNLLIPFTWPGGADDKRAMERSLRLFATEVMPRFKQLKAPLHPNNYDLGVRAEAAMIYTHCRVFD